jgi:hypothetical protein
MIKYELSSQVVELAPGQTTELKLSVINQSSLIDYFSLSLMPVESPEGAGFDPGWISLAPNTFSLRPGQQTRGMESDSRQDIQVLITLPPAVVAGNYLGQIRIDARTGSDNSGVIPLTLVVSELENQVLELQPAEVSSRGGVGIYRISLLNQGNATHLYPIYAEDSAEECRFEVIPPEVTLQPGERANLTLRVRPHRRNWASDEKDYDFAVKLEGFPQEVPGRFSQRCALPPVYWMRKHWLTVTALFIALIALLLIAAAFLLPSLNAQVTADCGPGSLRNFSLVSNDDKTSIYVSERSGREPQTKVVTENAEILPGLFASLVSVSADGRKLAYVTARNEALDEARIWVVDLETKKRLPLPVASIPAGLWPTAPILSADGTKLIYIQKTAAKNAATQITAVPATQGTPAANQSSTGLAEVNQLGLWLIDLSKDTPDPAKPLKDPKIQPTQLYGDNDRVVCFSTDNNTILIRNKTPDKSRGSQIQYSLPDGAAKETTPMPIPIQAFINTGNPVQQTNVVTNAASGCPTKRPYSQNDPRWSEKPLKQSDQSRIADFGCPLVAASILLNYYDLNTQPNDLISNCLADLSNPFNKDNWFIIGQNCSEGKLRSGTKEDFSWAALNNALQKGPAIVGLLGGQTGQHFVVVTSGGDNIADSYNVTDPWDGTTWKTLSYFLSTGYRLRWLITYQGPTLNCSDNTLANSGPDNISVNLNNTLDDGHLYQRPPTVRLEILGASQITATGKILDPANNTDKDKLFTLANNTDTPLRDNGFYNISIQAKNARSSQLIERNLYFYIDNASPIITPTLVAQQDKSNTYLAPASIKFLVVEPLSGLSTLEYQLDSQTQWELYNTETTLNIPTIKDSGLHTLRYRAKDGAGNEVGVGTFPFELGRPVTATTGTNPATGGIPGTNPGTSGTGAIPTVQNNPPIVIPPTRVVGPPTPAPTPRPPTATPTPLPTNTLAPVLPSATPRPTATLLPTSTALAPGSPSATSTPKPNPQLSVSLLQITFDTTSNTQTFQILNKGTLGDLEWSLQPDSAAQSLLKISNNSGKLAPGAAATISLDLVNLNLSRTIQNSTIQVNSNGGQATIRVVISPQPLPSATFDSLASDQLDALNIPVTLSISTPSRVTPDHAAITVNFNDVNGTPVTTTLQSALKADSSGKWGFSWNTVSLPSLTGVTLRGKLCVDAGESICTDIPALVVFFPLSASFTITPQSADGVLAPVTNIKVDASKRANHVSFFYTYQSLATSQVVTVSLPTVKALASNNWAAVPWNTNTITPTQSLAIPGPGNGQTGTFRNAIQLRGIVCSSADDNPNFCRNIPVPISNLTTVMSANISTIPDLTNSLPSTPVELSDSAPLTVTVSNPTDNIDHVSLYALYRDTPDTSVEPGSVWLSGDKQVARRTATTPPGSLIWDPRGIPPQSKITLAVYACFDPTETACTRIKNYTGVIIPYAKPYVMSAVSSRAVVLPTISSKASTDSDGFKVLVQDANGYPVVNKPVIYTVSTSSAQPPVPSTLFAFFSTTSSASVVVNTGSDGKATPPTLLTTVFTSGSGTYNIFAQMTGAAAGNRNLYLDWVLYNKHPNTAPFSGDGLNPTSSTFFEGPVKSSYTASLGLWNDQPGGSSTVDLRLSLVGQGRDVTDDLGSSADFTNIGYKYPGVFDNNFNLVSPPPVIPFSFGKKFIFFLATANPGITTFFPTYTTVNTTLTTNCKLGTLGLIAVSSSDILGSNTFYFGSTTTQPNYKYAPAIFNFNNLPGAAASLGAVGGTDSQSATVNSFFSKRLQLSFLDSCGNRTRAGIGTNTTISVSIGSNAGASATFENGATTKTYSGGSLDTNNILTFDKIKANGVAGTYDVTVSVSGVTVTNYTFKLTNLKASA